MTWFSKKHLDDAAEIAEIRTTNKIHKYCWHFVLSIKEAGMLFLLALGSVILSLDLEFQAVRMENCYVKKS